MGSASADVLHPAGREPTLNAPNSRTLGGRPAGGERISERLDVGIDNDKGILRARGCGRTPRQH